MNKLVVTKKSPQLQPIRKLIEKQNRRILALWGFDCAEHILEIFEKNYPNDKRPREAVVAAKAWARGEIKMPIAKKAALESHIAASEISEENPAASAAARVMGHLVGIIHVKSHAIIFVSYAITAFVHVSKKRMIEEVIEEKCKWLIGRLLYWEKSVDKINTTWASFLLKD